MNKRLVLFSAFLLLLTLVFPAVIFGCSSTDNLSEEAPAEAELFPAAAESSQQPEESQIPAETKVLSSSPVPSESPEPAADLSPSASSKSGMSPAATASTEPTASTKPAESPKPTVSPKPFPRLSAIPEPTASPIPTPTPAPTPTPTPAPTAVAARSYRLEVDVTNQVVSAYEKDEKGNYTKMVRQMICSSGKPSTPTPLGTYTLPGGKYDRGVWGYFSKFHVWARYFTRIKGGYLFHSVIYAKNDVKTLKQSTVNALGTPVSAGCIRLRVEDAKWIFDNAKPGTKVDIVKKEKNLELTAALKAGKPVPAQQPPEAVPVSLALDKKEKLEIKVGEAAQFKVIVTYSDKTEKDETVNVQWSLDKEGVAAVNNNTIQGITPGEVVLTAKFKGITASVAILVTEAVPPVSPDAPAGSSGAPAGTPDAPAGSTDIPAESPDVPAEPAAGSSAEPFPRP